MGAHFKAGLNTPTISVTRNPPYNISVMRRAGLDPPSRAAGEAAPKGIASLTRYKIETAYF
jgi:hypothetical protein